MTSSFLLAIADLIKGNEITFVPEGPFCLVPYAALEDSRSSYLSDSFSIRVLPSLTTLQLIHDCPAEFHMKKVHCLLATHVSSISSIREDSWCNFREQEKKWR